MAEDRRTESTDGLAELVEREEYSLASYFREIRNPSGAFVFVPRTSGNAAGAAELHGTVVPDDELGGGEVTS